MDKDTVIAATLLVALALSGCAATEAAKVANPKLDQIPPRFSKDVKPFKSVEQTNLFMTHLNLTSRYNILNLGNKLYVGDAIDRALEVFGPPPRAYDVTDLPPGWKEQGFAAAGWETSNEGFAAVLQKDRVGLAMFTVEHADVNLFARLCRDYGNELGGKAVSVGDSRTQYRFWSENGQTLMVCATNTPRFGWVVTVALGVQPLMDALRMNPDRAKEDLAEAVKLFDGKGLSPPGK